MSAGSLRHRIVIEEASGLPSANGDYSSRPWYEIDEVWANVKLLGGREREDGRSVTDLFAEITIRYRSDITPKMRVLHDSNVYEINDVRDMDGRKRYLIIKATERDL